MTVPLPSASITIVWLAFHFEATSWANKNPLRADLKLDSIECRCRHFTELAYFRLHKALSLNRFYTRMGGAASCLDQGRDGAGVGEVYRCQATRIMVGQGYHNLLPIDGKVGVVVDGLRRPNESVHKRNNCGKVCIVQGALDGFTIG